MVVIIFGLMATLVFLGWRFYRSHFFERANALQARQSDVTSTSQGKSLPSNSSETQPVAGVAATTENSEEKSDELGTDLDADLPGSFSPSSVQRNSFPDSDVTCSDVSNDDNDKQASRHPLTDKQVNVGESENSKPSERISADDLQNIQSIFSIDTFFVISQSAYYNGALFNGNLRGDPKEVHRILSQRLLSAVGPQYRLFLTADPQSKPVVLVFPTANDPVPSGWIQWLLALLLLSMTTLTCMIATATFQGFDLLQHWERWPETLFLVTGIMLILGSHEIGHWIAAHRYRLLLSPPFFLPTWQIGAFGALTRFESVVPHRTALFDVAFAGPAAGGAVSFFLFLIGLYASHPGSTFQLSPIFFQSSIFVGVLARSVLGDRLLQSLVDIDPLVIIGWLGLLLTAINLMPIGQLDGGRIVQAIYGRKVIRRTSIITLIVLAIATLFSPLALYWLVIILFLQRQLEQPQQNELSEPNDLRAALGLLVLFFMASMLLPLSPVMASRLGIGG